MGEAVISGRSGMEQLENRHNEGKAATEAPGGEAASSPSIVMWERFLPKIMLRVLLVEADDSTRQIIAALLRKCSYRVAAVADGLKAWEVLRARPCSIDLILTEVDLPLISGYALLTLITENEACKNIPVIMMSCHDSVSTVYKCMLRGATDFLVKPVRKNELRNLWQHVWRKQASSNAAGLGLPEESIGQKKDEATAENNAASDNNSSPCVACVRRSREERIEKGSDTQSSCTKLESRNDGDEDAETLHGHSQPESSKRICDGNTTEIGIPGKNSHEDKVGEAIDLIGAFDNNPNAATGAGASSISSKDAAVPHLNLSVQRSGPDGSMNNAEWRQLNHSQASPFSRYINKPVKMASSSSMYRQRKDHEIVAENIASSHHVRSDAKMHTSTVQSQKHVSGTMVQTGLAETTYPCSPDRGISHPIPVRGVRYENGGHAYDSLVRPALCVQAENGSYPVPSECQASCSVQVHGHLERGNSSSVDHTDKKSDKQGTEIPVSVGNNNHSSKANFCNGNMSHHHQNASSANNGNVNSASAVLAPSDCGNDESYHGHDGALQRSSQREAALMKFRLKRKERCFEKRVRYESRKKLAEQRPRVKGQFVRQAPSDPLPGNSAS